MVLSLEEKRTKHAAYMRDWRSKNPGKPRNNPETNRRRTRAAYLANPQRAHKRVKEWKAANPEKANEYSRRNQVMRKGAEHIPYGGISAIFERDGGHCQYCGVECILTKVSARNQATLDHVFPISLGGPDVESNVVLACRSCNSKKGTQVWAVFLSAGPQTGDIFPRKAN